MKAANDDVGLKLIIRIGRQIEKLARDRLTQGQVIKALVSLLRVTIDEMDDPKDRAETEQEVIRSIRTKFEEKCAYAGCERLPVVRAGDEWLCAEHAVERVHQPENVAMREKDEYEEDGGLPH
jgi:hypothetical protein